MFFLLWHVYCGSFSDSFIRTLRTLVSWGGRTVRWPLWLMSAGLTRMTRTRRKRRMKKITTADPGERQIIHIFARLVSRKLWLSWTSVMINCLSKQVRESTRICLSSPAPSSWEKTVNPPQVTAQPAPGGSGPSGAIKSQRWGHSEDRCSGDRTCQTQSTDSTNRPGSGKEHTARYPNTTSKSSTLLLSIELLVFPLFSPVVIQNSH